MFTEIVRNIVTLNRIERTLMYEMAHIFEENLPSSLYLNHYELEHMFGYTAKGWSKFLKNKEVSLAIESEMATIAEVAGRHALHNLQRDNASSTDISAAKELINNSSILKQKYNQRPQIIITRIPHKEEIVDAEH